MIKLNNVSKIYELSGIQVNAVKSVSLNINQGEFASIMGPSGSGKSTMMNILGCLDIPSTGEYFLDGIEIGSLTDNQLSEIRGEKVGFIFQTYNLLIPKVVVKIQGDKKNPGKTIVCLDGWMSDLWAAGCEGRAAYMSCI